MELMTAQHETERFRLTFGKNAERNGLRDEITGQVVRELFLAHSGNFHEPYWTVASDQSAPSKSKHCEQIMELAVNQPSMSYKEIADHVGCSKTTVSTYYPKTKKAT